MPSHYRIGIDVGGTFTHAVAIDNQTFALSAQVKVPTTHTAREGVAQGVAQALRALLTEASIAPQQVVFIAHSTTQATNALLEGDVAPVGIVAMGSGIEGARAKRETDIGRLELAPGRYLETWHTFLDSARLDATRVETAIKGLLAQGARAIVAAEAFSVDDPAHERLVMEVAGGLGAPCTGTHEVSGLYGLRVRTRTAVVNASILPRMLEVAQMTERAVAEAGIAAPLMVMRSDGGVMTAAEMRRRPILTILSGPAAGVAAALMHARVCDGIFLEVGGTSTDISLIHHGQAAVRSAEVGGHRLYLRTVDVRTIGVAGGSMPRGTPERVQAVGPRSAHLAGLDYAAFADAGRLEGAHAIQIAPREGDPADYLCLESPAGRTGLTLTDAANAAGSVPAGDYAEGNREQATRAFAAAGGPEMPQQMLHLAGAAAAKTVEGLLTEYKLERSATVLVGGGGGAGALVPEVARRLALPYRIAEHNAVISAIGVALALVRETVERTIPNPGRDDLLRLRREAEEAVVRAGAAPATVEVQVEIEAQQNIVRAIATGATELRARDLAQRVVDEATRRQSAACSLGLDPAQVQACGSTGRLAAYAGRWEHRRLLGLLRERGQAVRLVDDEGIVRLALGNAEVAECPAGEAGTTLERLLERLSDYGDAGRRLPSVFLAAGAHVINLSGLVTAEQVLSLAQAELSQLPPDQPVLLLAGRP